MITDLFADINEKILPFSLPDEEGYSYVWDQELRGFLITIPNGSLFYSQHFFDERISNRSLEYFLENDTVQIQDVRKFNWKSLSLDEFKKINFKNILWKQDFINIFGKKPLPRLTSWYGDEGKYYSYSGIGSLSNPWNKGLYHIKSKIEEVAKIHFNSVLLNWYRDGTDYLNWHADDEKELGKNPIIASVNFGETRDFVIRKNNDVTKKIIIPLEHGSLLIMRGELQHFWQHSVPKRLNIEFSRINLTFRSIE